MAVFKCKMCGGDLVIEQGKGFAECEYCGTKQTVPTAMDENLQNLFNRANTLRIKSEFDKAEKLYEKIIQADAKQSEAYWGLILCKYGIEYVDDPKTFKKIPTCHRASYDSIIADDDYRSAIENADSAQRAIYEEQAKEIDRIQKEILALAQKEETYDVFICYKETDANGQRTQDSVIANDIYYQLTQEGFKVFYAAITLEGKLGSAYEPIIFAALNSAKVMLSIGTKPEYFNAVWVKNEWSRFLKIIKKDRSKLLIPCYRDMDAYELPEEFAHLQAQDMAKIGFINDLVRGIKKVIKKDEPNQAAVVRKQLYQHKFPTSRRSSSALLCSSRTGIGIPPTITAKRYWIWIRKTHVLTSVSCWQSFT
jgi:tetratricopeptide (TPR) repeat protein